MKVHASVHNLTSVSVQHNYQQKGLLQQRIQELCYSGLG